MMERALDDRTAVIAVLYASNATAMLNALPIALLVSEAITRACLLIGALTAPS
jgi:hypothetical protein